MVTQELIAQLKLHEGVEHKPYIDTVGKMTIGVGRNLTDRGVSNATIEQMLMEDIELVQDELDQMFPDWCKLNDKRQRVLVDMCFNLGRPRFMTFVRFWAALRASQYDEAAKEMRDSRWYRQVGQRGETLAKMMEEG